MQLIGLGLAVVGLTMITYGHGTPESTWIRRSAGSSPDRLTHDIWERRRSGFQSEPTWRAPWAAVAVGVTSTSSPSALPNFFRISALIGNSGAIAQCHEGTLERLAVHRATHFHQTLVSKYSADPSMTT